MKNNAQEATGQVTIVHLTAIILLFKLDALWNMKNTQEKVEFVITGKSQHLWAPPVKKNGVNFVVNF